MIVLLCIRDRRNSVNDKDDFTKGKIYLSTDNLEFKDDAGDNRRVRPNIRNGIVISITTKDYLQLCS
jgi:hypothetical protein